MQGEWRNGRYVFILPAVTGESGVLPDGTKFTVGDGDEDFWSWTRELVETQHEACLVEARDEGDPK